VVAAATLVAAAPADATFTYYGGPVMHAVRIVVVDYGSGTYGTGTAYTTDDPNFFTTMAAASGTVGPVWGVLAEYPDTTGPAAYDWTYVSQTQITPSAGNNGSTITNSQLQTELANQITAGNLPAPTGNGMTTLYVVNFPAGKTISLNGSLSGVQFCAYHWSAAYNGGHLISAILPNVSSVSGCGTGTDIQNHEMVMSHEVSEAINDPLVGDTSTVGYPLAWYDPAHGKGEIADICNAIPATNLGFTVQKDWSQAQSACVSSGAPHFVQPTASFTPPTATATVPASFTGSGTSSNASDATTYNSVTYTIPAGISSYSWDFGDGGTGSGQNASHTYASAGPETVNLNVRDNLGFRAPTASGSLTVADAPPPPPPPPPSGGDTSGGTPASSTPTSSTPPTTTSTPSAPLPLVTVAGKARLVSKAGRLTLDTGRVAACPAGTGSCIVDVSATSATRTGSLASAAATAVTYGHVKLTVAAGHSVRIKVKLSSRVRKLIRRGRLRLTVRLLLQRGTGLQRPVAFPVSLRVPAARR
jgi:hypothetical protein